jgi:hypothetical protein
LGKSFRDKTRGEKKIRRVEKGEGPKRIRGIEKDDWDEQVEKLQFWREYYGNDND